MKIYLASRFSNHEKLRDLSETLAAEGHTVVSTWHSTEALSPVPRDHPDYLDNSVRAAERDLREISESDALILFTENCEAIPGGMWFEAGYAKALGKACYVLGPRINIFCHLCPNWNERGPA